MIKAIRNIVLDDYREDVVNKTDLKEKSNDMVVTLTGIPSEGVLIEFPGEDTHLKMINAQEKGITQSCDYLLLVVRKKHIDVYFIELKKSLFLNSKGVPEKAADQILYTTPVWDYLVSMANIHYGCKKKIKQHFTVIAERCSKNIDIQPPKSAKRNKQKKTNMNTMKNISYKGENFNVIWAMNPVHFNQL